MNAPDSLLSAELQELSLLLRYPRWMRWVVAATIAGSIFFVVLPLCALVARISEDRQEKEWGAITFLVLGCGSSAVYLIRHFRGFSEPVKVSKDMLAHRSTQMQWSDVTSAWESGFFNMLRIKDRNGQVLTFFYGLRGYDDLATIANEKKRANNDAAGNSRPAGQSSGL
jgi:hypothetical protein